MHACNSNLQFSDRHVLAGNCRTMHGVRSGAVQVFGGDTNNGHLTPAAPEGCRPAAGSGPPTANGMDCWSWSWFFQPSRGPCGTGKTWGISATRRRRGTDVVQSGRQEVGAAPQAKPTETLPHGLWGCGVLSTGCWTPPPMQNLRGSPQTGPMGSTRGLRPENQTGLGGKKHCGILRRRGPLEPMRSGPGIQPENQAGLGVGSGTTATSDP